MQSGKIVIISMKEPKIYYKELRFILPIYEANVIFVHTNSISKLSKVLEKEVNERPYAHAYRSSVLSDGMWLTRYIIVLNTKSVEGTVGIGCLAHESFHLTNMIMEDYGIFPDTKNDESQAYLLQYFVNKGTEFFFNYTYETAK